MIARIFLILLLSISISFHSSATEDHSYEAEKAGSANGHGDEQEEEGNSQVGPEKGILEASKDKGFRLSPEAERNFDIKKMKVASTSSTEIPKEAVLTAGIEVNLYRYRDGFFKRIDFEQIRKNQKTIIVSSKDLKVGDEIVIAGLGFLRIAEIAAFGGAPEGHSH